MPVNSSITWYNKMSNAANKKIALIIGAGSGLGATLATKFSKENYQVFGLNRSEIQSDQIKNSDIHFMQLDATNRQAVTSTMKEILDQYGVPDVVIHNAAQLYIKPFMETSAENFEQAWQSMVLSAVNVLQSVMPQMARRGTGNVIVSGATASLRGSANFSAFASAKFALRGLTQSLAREYQQQGVHVAHVILDGILDTPRSRELHSFDPARMMKTEDVASAYLQLVNQPPSTWVHELDLRPSTETF